MSSSNNRFGRRTDRQNDDLRAEPVLSFNNKRPAARGGQSDPAPSDARNPQAGPRPDRADSDAARFGREAQRDPIPSFMRGAQPGSRVGREDAREFGREFGMSFDGGDGPRIERDDDFDPRVRREKALDQRVPEAERPLYHHLFDEQESRRRGLGWLTALGSVAVIAIGAAYAWHNFMDRPAPAGLFEPPGFATRDNNNSGYMTPTQPTTDADKGLDAGSTGSTPSPLAATPPNSTNPDSIDQQATKDIASTPEPKSVPSEPPPPPKKTISEAAANPGSLGPAASPAPSPPPPAAKKEPVVAPAPIVTPPPKREAEASHNAPRKEASITPPKPAPAPAPQDIARSPVTEPAAAPAESAPPTRPSSRAPQEAAPPAVTEPAAAPAESAPPPRPRSRASQATGQPRPLNRNAPANYAPQQQAPQQQQPSFATRSPPPRGVAPPQQDAPYNNAGPPPGTPDTVTVDGVTYVNGQEPHSLGTLSGPPQAASSDAGMPPYAPPVPQPAPPPAYTARPYTPTDHDGGAPLPNDVVILPNGQMAVPNAPYGR